MHLRAPAFVKFHGGNPYPRLTVTSKPGQPRPGKSDAQWTFGPFPSRAAAERASPTSCSESFFFSAAAKRTSTPIHLIPAVSTAR